MRTEIEIIMPESWADVTLEKYLALQKDLETYKDNEEAQIAFMIYHLCGINAKQLKSLSKGSYDTIKDSLQSFLTIPKFELQRVINIDGKEYGFEPNLSKISYGAYADITKYDTLTIDDNWPKVMSILYRPIERKHGDNYAIQAYDGKIDGETFSKVKMGIHFGTLFFFVHLSKDLLNSTLNSMIIKEREEGYSTILARSGALTQRLLNSVEEMSEGYKK